MTVTWPDQTVWWDEADVVARVLVVLGVADDDPLGDRIAELVPAAGGRVNDYLDRPADDPVPAAPLAPPALVDALVEVVVAMYRRKDSPPSSVDGMLAGAWPAIAVDPIAGVRAALIPYKRRWGIG